MNTFSCLYTKQKEKKRKTWSDGKLKVNMTTGHCSLHTDSSLAASQKCLESRMLINTELTRLRGLNDDVELEFENHIVMVEPSISQNVARKVSSSTKNETSSASNVNQSLVKAFKAPQMLTNPQSQLQQLQSKALNHQQQQQETKYAVGNSKRSLYRVTEDDLNDIWGNDEDPVVNSTSTSNSTYQDYAGTSDDPQYSESSNSYDSKRLKYSNTDQHINSNQTSKANHQAEQANTNMNYPQPNTFDSNIYDQDFDINTFILQEKSKNN